MRTLGEDNVTLYGEESPKYSNKIKLYQPSVFLDGLERYDIIINANSMTEMSREAAQSYWNRIRNDTTKFLSINHGANSLLSDSLLQGMRSTSRRQSATRTGCGRATLRKYSSSIPPTVGRNNIRIVVVMIGQFEVQKPKMIHGPINDDRQKIINSFQRYALLD
jgi:hypothetical protein